MNTYRTIHVGDYVTYRGRSGHACHGLVAERTVSPLSGRVWVRVVDFPADADDPEAGRWIDVLTDVIAVDWKEQPS